MPIGKEISSPRIRRSNPIRLGYVRLLDAAPIIVADSLGWFRDAGLSVALSREIGWATIRDKLAFGQLDIAQSLSPLLFAMRMGIGVSTTDVITGLVLNANGNAITLSCALMDEGVQDGAGFARYVKSGYRTRKPVLGVVSLYSSHHYMVCRWLRSLKLVPQQDVIISVIPPEQMVRNLASGNIDGFCVGEPWNSLAVEEKIGWCPTTSAEIAPGYPEKVLATTERFHWYRNEEHLSLIEVLTRACAYCEDTAFRKVLFEILSKPNYLNCAPKTLACALSGQFPMDPSGKRSEAKFIRFSGEGINRPSQESAAVVYEDFKRFALPASSKPLSPLALGRVFRQDIFDQASSLIPN